MMRGAITKELSAVTRSGKLTLIGSKAAKARLGVLRAVALAINNESHFSPFSNVSPINALTSLHLSLELGLPSLSFSLFDPRT